MGQLGQIVEWNFCEINGFGRVKRCGDQLNGFQDFYHGWEYDTWCSAQCKNILC